MSTQKYTRVRESIRKYEEVQASTRKYFRVPPQHPEKEEMFRLPLSRRVNFKTTLKRANLFQVSKINRWQLKLEPDQVLRVGIRGLGDGWEFFQGWVRMDAYSFQKQSCSRRMVEKKIWQAAS